VAARRGPLLLVAVLVAAGCSDDQGHEVDSDAASTITVTSDAFAEGDTVPERFTCDGEEVSPPLAWSGGQRAAWALVVDDPDAPGGTYVHWVVVDIAEPTTAVRTGEVPAGGVQIANSAGDASYAGPCPPGGEHRYRFTVYALDATTGLTERASTTEALDAIRDHATAQGRLTAVYARP
jgi:Raf kinase inhibitor-like YbhB/YbcL family protein